MDEFLNKPLIMKITALLMTLFLFAQVTDTDAGRSLRNIVSSVDRTLIEEVPLEIIYDEEVYVVSGAPEHVNVKLSGPKSLVFAAENRRDFQAIIELKDPPIGEQLVSIELVGLSEQLEATIDPEEVTINVQERVDVLHDVKADYSNVKFADGYQVASTVIEPEKVEVVGGIDTVNRVDSVVVIIEKSGRVSSDFSGEGEVIALDAEGQILPVTIVPDIVKFSTSVTIPAKEVPLVTATSGTLADGLTLDKIELEETSVKIVGSQNILDEISEIKVPVDLSEVTESTEIFVDIPVPRGASSISPTRVKVNITITETIEREFPDISVTPINVADSLSLSFPNEDTVALTVKGIRREVEALRASDFTLTIDVTDLEAGRHKMPIQLKGPDELDVQLKPKTITVLISQQ